MLSSFRDTFTMLVASLLKKFLWVLRYPSFDTKLLGDYDVGAVQTRIPGSVACQIHYPTNIQTTSRSSPPKRGFVPYFRPQAVQGLADYSRMPVHLLEFLSRRQHPCHIDAAPIPDQQFPIVVFSHGLGGCMELYTQLCRQISSCGFFVVAMEHEDGSGCYAENEWNDKDGTTTTTTTPPPPVLYQRPDDSPYTRQKVTNFRKAFLQQRVEETTRVLEYILLSASAAASAANKDQPSNLDTNDAPAKAIFQAADTTQGISLLGHSFGGASMTLAAQDYLSTKGSSKIKPTSVSLLDCWAFSLEDEVLDTGLSGIPTLSILSEAWLTNPETAQVKELLANSGDQVTSLYAPTSVHSSVSDSSSWLPGVILRKFRLRGPNEKRHATIRAVAQACVGHMQHHSSSSDTTTTTTTTTTEEEHSSLLKPFPFDKQKQVPVLESTVSASS
jgi:dienelactone hydrolase